MGKPLASGRPWSLSRRRRGRGHGSTAALPGCWMSPIRSPGTRSPDPRGPERPVLIIPVVTFLEPIEQESPELLLRGGGKPLAQALDKERLRELRELEDLQE